MEGIKFILLFLINKCQRLYGSRLKKVKLDLNFERSYFLGDTITVICKMKSKYRHNLVRDSYLS